MKSITVEAQPNASFRGRKIRALNTNGKSLRLFSGVKDASKFFKMSISKIRTVIEGKKIMAFENNTYTLERYS